MKDPSRERDWGLVVVVFDGCGRLMIKLGYRWGKGAKKGARILESDQKQADTFRLALEWSEALQMEDDGTHVIVYMDESLCNTGHTYRNSWFLVENSQLEFANDGKFSFGYIRYVCVMRFEDRRRRRCGRIHC